MLKRFCVLLFCMFVLINASGCDINISINNGNDNVRKPNHLAGTHSDADDVSSDSTPAESEDDTVEPEGDTAEPESDTVGPEDDIKVDAPESKSEYGMYADLLETMSYDERYEINIFLSNFSEAMYGTSDFGETEDMINFAYTHNCLNNKNYSPTFKDDKFWISYELVNSTLKRFFGKTVPPQTPPGSLWWGYENGQFTCLAASGESHAYFTTATCVTNRNDGLYDVDFIVFFNANDPHGDMDKKWYGMTAGEAAQYFEFCYDGKAVLEPTGDTYRLVSYITN